MLISLLMASTAFATDCDTRTMSKEILAAGPHEAAPMFVQLAQCDGPAAARVAGKVIPTLIGESDGFNAAVTAIEVGAGVSVMAWIPTLQRDEMSRAIRAFGKECQTSEKVQGFLIEAHKTLGDQFWTDRWYRALTECRTDASRVCWLSMWTVVQVRTGVYFLGSSRPMQRMRARLRSGS